MSVPTSWQPLPIDTNPAVITARVMDNLRTKVPGWVAREGSLDVAIAEEIAREVAATNARTADVADYAVAGIGVTVDGLAPITGAAATIPVTIITTVPGAVVPAGTYLVGTGATGVPTTFQVAADVTSSALNAPAGQGRADVTLTALTVGVAGNGVPVGALSVITATGVIVSVTSTATSSGGIDPESRSSYLTRLIAFRSTLRPGAVRATDTALLARGVAGVQRALAVDNYDAQTDTANVARCVSVFPVDSAGAPVAAAVKTALQTYLEGLRETNFIFRVGTPTYTALAVAFTAQARPGQDATVVRGRIIDALTAYLSPAAWGASSVISPTDWTAKPTVRRDDLVIALGAVDGLAFLSSLTLNGGTADVTLPGRAALPASTTAATPTTITGTVS